MHPFVNGMGMGEMDAGYGPSRSKGVQPALDKRLAAKTRAWSSTRYFGNGLRQWRQPLSAPSHAHFSGERKKQRLRNLRHTPSASSNIPLPVCKFFCYFFPGNPFISH